MSNKTVQWNAPRRCCVCGEIKRTVRNIGMLPFKGEPGTGWGCVQCGLPPDGVSFAACDACTARAEDRPPRYFIKGYFADYELVPIEELDRNQKHEHDLSKHPEVRQ